MKESTLDIQSESQAQNLDQQYQTRIQLAAVYRLIDHFGWSDLVLTHASTRVPNSDEHFFVNPFGIKFNEIKASDLVTMDMSGNLIGENQRAVSRTAFVVDTSIYPIRNDINAIIHAHSPYGVALSTLECGLLYLDQAAIFFHDKLGYHDYQGLPVDVKEKKSLIDDLGTDKSCLILRNHGLLACGKTIDEAFINLYLLECACRTQVLAMSTGAKLIKPSTEIIASFAQQAQKFKQKTNAQGNQGGIHSVSFKALMDKLDRLNPSYRN
jgi:ribulose-5-phosphate 4-epimerase/fuculose-1-phosphate aldolase